MGAVGRVFRTDDPTDELSAAWGIKEQLRRLLATDTLAQAWNERMRMGYFVQIANMPEATKLYDPTWLTLVPRGDAGLDRLDRGRGVLLERDRGRDLLVADGHDALAVDA